MFCALNCGSKKLVSLLFRVAAKSFVTIMIVTSLEDVGIFHLYGNHLTIWYYMGFACFFGPHFVVPIVLKGWAHIVAFSCMWCQIFSLLRSYVCEDFDAWWYYGYYIGIVCSMYLCIG